MAKNITDFLEILFEYHFLNIIMNVNSFSDLKFERYCEYYPGILLQVSPKQETKIDGRDHEIFSKKLLGHEIFRSMVSWATIFFFEKFVKSSGPPSYICTLPELNSQENF